MYDVFTNPVVGYLQGKQTSISHLKGFFCVNFMVPGTMTRHWFGWCSRKKLGRKWAISANWNPTKPDNKKCWKRRKTPSCWRITSYPHDFLRSPPFFGDHNHATDWYHFWNGIIDGFDLLKAQQIAVPGPLDGHKPPLPICPETRSWKGWRFTNSWMIESKNPWGKSLVGNFEIPNPDWWKFWQSLTNPNVWVKRKGSTKTRPGSVDEKQVANQLRWEMAINSLRSTIFLG